ncbi:MAG: hypothetical protein QM775_31040 [Pirellulales bacterium]
MSTVSIPDTPSQACARAIMGKNFLGIEEVRAGYGFSHTDEQRQLLSEIPFSDETLQRYKDTHVLVAGAPLSVNEIRKIAGDDVFSRYTWYKREPFANDQKLSVRWYLLRKEPVPGSCGKKYEEQASPLTNEEVPFACEMTYMVILYSLTRGERLFQDVYVRCQDKLLVVERIFVGHYDPDGLVVDSYGDFTGFDTLGLASSVVPDKS